MTSTTITLRTADAAWLRLLAERMHDVAALRPPRRKDEREAHDAKLDKYRRVLDAIDEGEVTA